MGATVSVCNLTLITINVALKQLGPIYYVNQLEPDGCASFKTGRVWFTIEAKIFNRYQSNDYDLSQSVILPVGTTLLTTGLVTTALNGYDLADANRKGPLPKDVLDTKRKEMAALALVSLGPGVVVTTAGIIKDQKNNIDKRLFVKKDGVLMKDNTWIEIRGGPDGELLKRLNSEDSGFFYDRKVQEKQSFDSLRIQVTYTK